MTRPRRFRTGVTLMEIMTVLAIAGIMAAMSAGRISAYITSQRVLRAATAFQNDMETAFAIAARNRRPIRLAWNATSMQFQITDRTGTTVFRRSNLKEGYNLLSGEVVVSASPVEVFPGGLASSALQVTITAVRGTNTYTKTVNMTRAGLVTIQ
jgi:prepilin-type N-terminal cleavage/methylation domain-containing protein